MRVTVLGLGRMGCPMARNLIELGHDVTLYDRDRERTLRESAAKARAAFTVADAVSEAQVALTMVTGDAAVEDLAFGPGGLLRSLPRGAIHLCMSTIGVELSRRLALRHQESGQGYVAAPVLGKPSFAASRQLWILAAGPEAQVNRCLVVLEGLGRSIIRVGDRPELAHALKLGASALAVALAEGLAEVLAFGERAGIPPADYLRILNLGLMKSPLLDAYGGLMVRRDHDPSDLTLDLAGKDLALLDHAARGLDLPMPLVEQLLGHVEKARAQGLGNRDITGLALVRRKEARLDEPREAAPAPAEPAPPPPAQGDRRVRAKPRKPGEPERRRGSARAPAGEARKAAAPEARKAQPADPRRGPEPVRLNGSEREAVAVLPGQVAAAAPPPEAPPLPEPLQAPAIHPLPPAPHEPVQAPPIQGEASYKVPGALPVPPAPAPGPAPVPEPAQGPEPAPPAPPGPAPAPARHGGPRPADHAPYQGQTPLPFQPPEPAAPAQVRAAAGEARLPKAGAGSLEARVDGSTFSVPGVSGPEMLDLEDTTHFEERERAVWAWVEGRPRPTFWRSFHEVELALGHVLFIRIQPTLLLNPNAVLDLKPIFGGRAKVVVAGGLELTASRDAARKLKFILGV